MSRNEHPCVVSGRPWTASHSSLIVPALVEWLRFLSFHTKFPLSLLHFLSYSSSSPFSSNSRCSRSSSVQLLPHMLMCGVTLHPPRSHDMSTHMLSLALATSMHVRTYTCYQHLTMNTHTEFVYDLTPWDYDICMYTLPFAECVIQCVSPQSARERSWPYHIQM